MHFWKWVQHGHACWLARGCVLANSNSSAAVADVLNEGAACRGVFQCLGTSRKQTLHQHTYLCVSAKRFFPLLLLYQHCILALRSRGFQVLRSRYARGVGLCFRSFSFLFPLLGYLKGALGWRLMHGARLSIVGEGGTRNASHCTTLTPF